MTVNELQKCLIKEIEQITKEMSFLDCERNPASMKGYPQAIPIWERTACFHILLSGQTALSIRQTIKTGKGTGSGS